MVATKNALAWGERAERLSSGNVPRNAIGELVRAAACGVNASTPREVRMAIRSDENSLGGFSIPDQWLANWYDRAGELSVLAPYAQRAIMSSESLNITTVEARPTIAVKGELDKFTESGITFGGRRLQAFTAGVTMLASLEMLSDSPNAKQQTEAVALRALADWLDETMLNGSGSQEPLGLLNRNDLPSDGSAGDITWEAIADAVTELRSEVYPPSGVVCSPAVFNSLNLQRELSGGDGGFLARPEHLQGVPFLVTSHCPDEKVLVADLSQVMIGVRENAVVEVSNSAGESFERNAVTFRIKTRQDFVPLDLNGFYLLGGVTLPS